MKQLIFFLLLFTSIFAQDIQKDTSHSLAIDSSIGNWRIFNSSLGLGMNISQGNDGDSYADFTKIFTVGFGFDALNGIGFSTTVWEYYDNKFKSFLPVYIHYPLYSSQPINIKSHKRKLRKSFIHIIVGGTAWGYTTNYLNYGIDYIFFSTDIPADPSDHSIAGSLIKSIPYANFSLKTGSYIPIGEKKISNRYYLLITLGLGGVFQ